MPSKSARRRVAHRLSELFPEAEAPGPAVDTRRTDRTGDSGSEGNSVNKRESTPPKPRASWRVPLLSAILLSCLVASVFFGNLLFQQHQGSTPVASLTDQIPVKSQSGYETSAASTSTQGPFVIHVLGAVHKPGVYRLAPGSRVFQAIEAAGGLSGEAAPGAVNLAAPVEDGQQIRVLTTQEFSVSASSDHTGVGTSGPKIHPEPTSSSKVNLNTASAEQLQTLPKIGPALAQRIISWRAQRGGFKTVEELDAVDGIGPKLLETLLPLVRV